MTTNEITASIRDEYPDLYEYEKGPELINVVYSLGEITNLRDSMLERIIAEAGFESYSREEQ